MKSYILSSSFKSFFILLLLIVIGGQYLAAQTLSQNQDGEKIILYNDGSWRYFDDANPDDMALLENSDPGKKVKTKSKKINPFKVAKKKKPKVKKDKPAKFKGGKTKIAKSPKDKSSKLKGSKTKVAKVKKQKKGKSGKAYTNTNTNKSKKLNLKSEKGTGSVTSRKNYRQIINKEIIKLRDKQNMALEKERIANFAAQKYGRDLKLAKKRKLDKEGIKTIDSKYKQAKLQLKLARNQNKALLKQRRSYEVILKKEPHLYANEYSKLAAKYNKDFDLVPTFDEDELAVSSTRKKAKETKKKNLKIRSGKSIRNNDVVKEDNTARDYEEDKFAGVASQAAAYQVSYPSSKPDVSKAATPNCNIAFEGKDSFSGKKRKDLAKRQFFTFTSDKLRAYFEEGDMIQCDAYMSGVAGGYKFICLEVLVSSETAQRSYGSIEKQGLFSIKLVDGTTINLYNNKTDYGFLDPIKKTVLYKAQYLIPNEHVKTLSKVDIDLVRLVWSTGYEDYTIYETDFLINQLNCLDN